MDLHTSCTICDNQYDEKKRRPLVLPCSHSFCQDCLQLVQAAGEKLCPVCRKTWNTILVSDLPSCYQLIPNYTIPDTSLLKALRKRKRQDSADLDLEFNVCKEHKSDLSMFCESCVVPVCRKCLLLNHKGCEVVLMEKKCDALDKKFYDKISELEKTFSKVNPSLSENVTNLAVIRPLIEKLLGYEKDMQDYQKELKDWQKEAAKVLAVTDYASAAPLLCNIQNTLHNVAVVEKLDLQLPTSPSYPLLWAIATAYQEGHANNDSFLTAFQNCKKEFNQGDSSSRQSGVKVEPNQGASTSMQSVDMKELNRAVRIAALALKDGELWNILDDSVADAAVSVLQTTFLRPSSIEIHCHDITEEKLAVMAIGFAGYKQYEVTLKEKMNTFASFDLPSDKSLAVTALRLDALVKHSPWAPLTHFWGHLNVDGIHALPNTIQSLGLVLRDEADMASVDALRGIAFNLANNPSQPDRMIWPQFSRLELSISKTFSLEFWKLSWYRHSIKGHLTVALSSISHFTVSLNLPDLGPEDHLRTAALLKVMGMNPHHTRPSQPLYLPGVRIDPDPLLGVLRDSGLCWEVHLPTSLPQLVPRGEVAERYKKYGHSVTWDLQ